MSEGTRNSDKNLRARRAALGLAAVPSPRVPPPPQASARNGASGETPTGGKNADASAKQSREIGVFIGFVIIAISATWLQIVGIPLGSSDSVGALIVPVMYITLAAMCYFVRPEINPVRFGLFFLLVTAAAIGTNATANKFSPASLALFIVLYAPFMIAFPISETTYRRCLNMFCTTMVILAGFEFLQHGIQLVAGRGAIPNPYKLIPDGWLVPGFNYIQLIVWGSPYIKPQAWVFLEASLLSQFLALAISIEVLLFRRVWRIVWLVAALFATFAGTGLLLLAFALPVLLGRMSMRNTVLIVLAVVVVAAVATNAGWLDAVDHRLNEFGKSGASANHRFVEPLERIISSISRPGSLYSGIGAGQIEKTDNHQFWPIAKAIVEYGLFTGLALYAFLIHAMFDRPASRALAFTLLLWFTFEGALLTAVNPLTCVLLSSMFIVDRGRRSGGKGADAAFAGTNGAETSASSG